MSEEDRDPNDGASAEETEVKHPSLLDDKDEQEAEFHPFDELHDDFKPITPKTTAEDGMPSVQDSQGDDDIPPLSPESLVCMGDFSKFVKRDIFGEIVSEHSPDEVEQLPNGKWYLKEGLAEAKRLWKENYRDKVQAALVFSQVDPLRMPCKHYVRQLGIGSGQVTVTYRLCAARRTTEGTFMTVRDTAVWACSMRDPRDIDTEHRHLDVFDEQKMREGATRTKHSIFSGKGLG